MRIAGILCALAVLVTSCGGDGESSSAPSELEGPITSVEGQNSHVPVFVLEADGKSYEIHVISDLDYGFDLAHLREHELTAEPVRIRVEEREGVLYALRIDDARDAEH